MSYKRLSKKNAVVFFNIMILLLPYEIYSNFYIRMYKYLILISEKKEQEADNIFFYSENKLNRTSVVRILRLIYLSHENLMQIGIGMIGY